MWNIKVSWCTDDNERQKRKKDNDFFRLQNSRSLHKVALLQLTTDLYVKSGTHLGKISNVK